MIFDNESIMSDKQAVTATAVSTNVIDLGAQKDIGRGKPIPIRVQVTTDFATLTSLQIDLQTDADEAFSDPVVLQGESVAAAALVAGKVLNFNYIPKNGERYLRMNYTVTGSDATAGNITAGIVMEHQDNP